MALSKFKIGGAKNVHTLPLRMISRLAMGALVDDLINYY